MPDPSTSPVCEYEQILYQVRDPVATITLNRPASMNGWTARMGAELRDAVCRADDDPAVVGIVLTGAGRAFCAGADMSELAALSETGAETEVEGRSGLGGKNPADLDGELTYLMAARKPIVAAINGPVAGLALPLVLCCDLRIMADTALIVTAFAQRGLIGELGVTWLLPRLVGPAVALDLLFSSRRVTAEEAVRLGLVNRVVAADDVVAEAERYVAQLAVSCSPRSLAIIKRQVHEQINDGLARGEREAKQLRLASYREPDLAEGVRSYLEKRPPQFARVGQGLPDPFSDWP